MSTAISDGKVREFKKRRIFAANIREYSRILRERLFFLIFGVCLCAVNSARINWTPGIVNNYIHSHYPLPASRSRSLYCDQHHSPAWMQSEPIHMIRGQDLVSSLIIASEKAAHVARICRENDHLLSLLVEEKTEVEKNCRFIKDFKTLADVLVQQSIKFDLKREFPDLKDCIYGEENDSFTNTLGDSVTFSLNENRANTLRLLGAVLNGDEEAAHLLTECVHSQISINDVPVEILPPEFGELSAEKLALWIDPIDSTSEYMSGRNTSNYEDEYSHIPLNGLNCVTVLIGVFDKITGIPVIGVINQPFYTYDDNRWRGRCFWGVCYDNNNFSCIPAKPLSALRKTIIAVSAVEKEETRKKLEEAGFILISPAGAGFKILCVILDVISAYVLSYGSTYYWDTCGCHAVIKSLGGDIWSYRNAVKKGELNSILYEEKRDYDDVKLYSNKCGIIASKDHTLARQIVNILKQNDSK